MSTNLKIFFIALFVGFNFFWAVNLIDGEPEGLLYQSWIKEKPEMYLAQMSIIKTRRVAEAKENSVGVRVERVKELELEAESAISVLVTPEGEEILFGKNISEIRPIASITKLVTALTILDLGYKPNQLLEISKEAITQEEETGKLKPGEVLFMGELMHSMLIESSNDSAWAIAEGKLSEEDFIGEKGFVDLMNKEIESLGLENTYFVNPTGLNGYENYSTSEDLVKITQYILEKYPHIFEITRKESYEVSNPDGSTHHFISENTNELLKEMPEIIGGKTGFTDEAGGCLLLVLETKEGNYWINIVLGAESPQSRFEEVKRLIYYCEDLI